jgi:hypothetical protein
MNMPAIFTRALHILAISGRGIQCATSAAPTSSFWLPRQRNHVTWVRPPQVGAFQIAVMPYWLAARHRQLVGDVEFERARDNRRSTAKEMAMADRPVDAGTGALFKNDKREKDTHPNYRGDCTIHGRKFWVSAWIKDGKNGKFMSLAFREADEPANGKPKPRSAQMADSEAPF